MIPRGSFRASAFLLASGFFITCLLAACQQTRPVPPAPTGPPPAYADVVAVYNARVALLDRLWCRATVRFTAKDENGKKHTEQGEGYLQIVLPDRLLLSMGAYIADMYLRLGSNDQWYWWINTLEDDHRFALVGDMASASRETSARLGMPVHPLDLIELIGITALPESGNTSWSADGRRIRFEAPARWGRRAIEVNPATFEPERIELLDDAGALVAFAELTAPTPVQIESGGTRPTIPGRVFIEMPSLEAQVILDLREAENSSRRPKSQVFDLQNILKALRITDVRSVDQPSS